MTRLQALGNMSSLLFGHLVAMIFSSPKKRTAQLKHFLRSDSSFSNEENITHGPVSIKDALAGLHYCFILLAAQLKTDPNFAKSFYLSFVPTKNSRSVFEVKGEPVIYILSFVLRNCGYKFALVVTADKDSSSDEVVYHVKQTTLNYAV